MNGVSTLYLSINSNQNGHNSTVLFFSEWGKKEHVLSTELVKTEMKTYGIFYWMEQILNCVGCVSTSNDIVPINDKKISYSVAIATFSAMNSCISCWQQRPLIIIYSFYYYYYYYCFSWLRVADAQSTKYLIKLAKRYWSAPNYTNIYFSLNVEFALLMILWKM